MRVLCIKLFHPHRTENNEKKKTALSFRNIVTKACHFL